jgi:DNA-binding NtrC family response regulator
VPRKILIIEDDDLYSGAIEAALAGEYEVMLHESAPELDVVHEFGPALVLLDNTLPGISGADYLRLLKQDSRAASIPVVLMSGNHDILRQEPSLQEFCAGFLPKPFTLDKLVETIHSALPA